MSIRWGPQNHYNDFSTSNLTAVVKLYWVALPFATLSLMFGRISLAAVLLSILGGISKRRRQLLWILLLLQLPINIIFIILIFCQCHLVEKLWDWAGPGYCWPQNVLKNYAYAQGGLYGVYFSLGYLDLHKVNWLAAINSFTDLSLTILAASLVYPLRVGPVTKAVFISATNLSIL